MTGGQTHRGRRMGLMVKTGSVNEEERRQGK